MLPLSIDGPIFHNLLFLVHLSLRKENNEDIIRRGRKEKAREREIRKTVMKLILYDVATLRGNMQKMCARWHIAYASLSVGFLTKRQNPHAGVGR